MDMQSEAVFQTGCPFLLRKHWSCDSATTKYRCRSAGDSAICFVLMELAASNSVPYDPKLFST
eukprot:5862938-Amphidinium_carterae.1